MTYALLKTYTIMPYCLFISFCFPINVEPLPCVYTITLIVIANIIIVIIIVLLDHLKPYACH